MEDLLLIKEKICSTDSVFAIIAQKNSKLKSIESLHVSVKQKNSELIVSTERLSKELEDLQSFNAEYTAKYLEVKQQFDGLQLENEALKLKHDKRAKEYEQAKDELQKTTKKLKFLELSKAEHQNCKKKQERMKEELQLCNEKCDALQLEKAVLEEQGVYSQLLDAKYQKCLADLKKASDDLDHCNKKLVSVETCRKLLETENVRLQTLLDERLKNDHIAESCSNVNCLSRESELKQDIERLTADIQKLQKSLSPNTESKNEDILQEELLDSENIEKILSEMLNVPQMLEPILDPINIQNYTKCSEDSSKKNITGWSTKSIQTDLFRNQTISAGVQTEKKLTSSTKTQTDVQTSFCNLYGVSKSVQTDLPLYIKNQCLVNNESTQTASTMPQNRNLHPRLSIKTAIRLLKKKQIDITIKGGRLLKYNDNRNRLKPFPAVEKRMERKILNKVIEYIHHHFDSEQISSRLRQLKNVDKVKLDLPKTEYIALTRDSLVDSNDFDSGYASNSARLQEELLGNSAIIKNGILYPNLYSTKEEEIEICDKPIYNSDINLKKKLRDLKDFDTEKTNIYTVNDNESNNLKCLLDEMKMPEILSPIMNQGDARSRKRSMPKDITPNHAKRRKLKLAEPSLITPVQNRLKGKNCIVANSNTILKLETIATEDTNIGKKIPVVPHEVTKEYLFGDCTDLSDDDGNIARDISNSSNTSAIHNTSRSQSPQRADNGKKLKLKLEGQYKKKQVTTNEKNDDEVDYKKENNVTECMTCPIQEGRVITKGLSMLESVSKKSLFVHGSKITSQVNTISDLEQQNLSTCKTIQKRSRFQKQNRINNAKKVKSEGEIKKHPDYETNDHTYCVMSTMEDIQAMQIGNKKVTNGSESVTYPIEEFDVITEPVEPSIIESVAEVPLFVINSVTSDEDLVLTNITARENTIDRLKFENHPMCEDSLPVIRDNNAQEAPSFEKEKTNTIRKTVSNKVEDDSTCHNKKNEVLESEVIPQTLQNEANQMISVKKLEGLERAMAPQKQNTHKSWLVVKKRLLSYIQFRESRAYLTRTAKQLNALDVKTLVTYLLRLISTDTDVAEKGNSPFEPHLTTRQRALLGLLLHLDKEYKPKIIDIMLQKCENQILFSIKDTAALEPVVRFFTAICKMRRCKSRLRQLICNGLYFMDDLVIPLIFYVLVSWIDLFRKYNESDCNPFIKVIIQVVHTKRCHMPEYRLGVLKNLLQVYYKFPSERFNENTLFSELLELYMCTFQEQYKLALLIICKNSDYTWTHKKVLLIKEIILLSKDMEMKNSLVKILEAIYLTCKSNKSHSEKCLDVLKSLTNDYKGCNLQPVVNEVIKITPLLNR